MPSFEVLGTDQTVDPTDPTGSIVTILYVIAGAAVLFMALPIGRQVANKINGGLSSLLSTDVGGDGDTFGSLGGGF
jgi:S1-C subfamily serine protease